MQDIINSINEAEARAAEIKAQAQQLATEKSREAEERCAEMQKISEAECKLLRENRIKAAEDEALNNYNSEIAARKAEAKSYADGCLRNADEIVETIVRRITRGGC